MGISEDNTRTNITFPKWLKKELEEIAEKDKRSFNNMVIKILTEYIEELNKDKDKPHS